MFARKARFFWPVLLAVALVDCGTKRLAVERLAPTHEPLPVVGDVVRFTLAYNPGAAMSIPLPGSFSRVGLAIVTMGALFVLARLYARAERGDVPLAVSIALVAGGAVGNLIDRLRSARGVVDFIDVGVGDTRFYIFNVADVGVTLGALALAMLIWRREARGESQRAAA